ncbi:hypothetical protein PG995_013104 [Apiospora arundinis]
MHSYGGVDGPEALEGTNKKERTSSVLQGGVVVVIFAAAYIAPKGMSAIETMGLDPVNLPDFLEHDKPAAKAILIHDLPDEEGKRLAGLLPKQPHTCFTAPVRWDPYHDPNFEGCLGFTHTEA